MISARRISQALDIFAVLCLFICGSFVVRISITLWFGPLRSLADPLRGGLLIAAGAIVALSAIALFFMRRVAGAVGAITLFALACYYAWSDPVIADLLLPAAFVVVGAFVYWRFVRPRGASPTI